MTAWEDLRKQARRLENEIDLKLVSFSKVGTGVVGASHDSDTEPLLSPDHLFESVAMEIESLLSKLAAVNDKMGDLGNNEQCGGVVLHTLQRHREILQDYTLEFRKTKENHRARKEREELLQSVRKDIDSYKSNTGLNRRMDLYLKENEHIRSSDRMVDDQITIAVETRDHLVSQRLNMKKLQTRLHDITNRFPVVNSLVQRINLRKRRDSIIIGLVVATCTLLLLYYAFH